jgi:TRAP-type mannitol/chloroaromatic compound transport system permease small subunit
MPLLLKVIDGISTWSGKISAWLIVILTFVVSIEVVKRYILNAPTAWIFDLNSMLYGTLFMLCGAYALANNAHVRGDFLYSSMPPRRQAAFDLVLYFLFFVPGILALIYAGVDYAGDSWRIHEHSTVTADGPPMAPFKSVIPIAGALVMLQGVAEIVRCVICLKTGVWPERARDVEEIDVIQDQLSQSVFVDDESRRYAIDRMHDIDDAAQKRGMGETIAAEQQAHAADGQAPR